MNDGPIRVYKVGGPALEDPALIGALADEVRGGRGPAALVHGGGRRVGRLLRALGIESRFVNGRRETSPAAMEVVEMVLSGVVNKSLAAGLTGAGVPALGLSGRDAGLIRARLEPDLGRVGTPERVYLADVDGVRVDGETVSSLTAAEARRRIADGTIAGGMALKVRVALDAAAQGIPEVVIAGKARLLGSFSGTRVGAKEEA